MARKTNVRKTIRGTAVRKEGLGRDLQNLFQSGPAASVVAAGAKCAEAPGQPQGCGHGGTGGKAGAPLDRARTTGEGLTGGMARGGAAPLTMGPGFAASLAGSGVTGKTLATKRD